MGEPAVPLSSGSWLPMQLHDVTHDMGTHMHMSHCASTKCIFKTYLTTPCYLPWQLVNQMLLKWAAESVKTGAEGSSSMKGQMSVQQVWRPQTQQKWHVTSAALCHICTSNPRPSQPLHAVNCKGPIVWILYNMAQGQALQKSHTADAPRVPNGVMN